MSLTIAPEAEPLTGTAEVTYSDLDELVAAHLWGEKTIEADRVHHWGGTGPAHVLDDRMPSGWVERVECARYPELWVWASDNDLAVLVWRAGRTEYGDPVDSAGRLELDIFLRERDFHARLDDLAGLV